MSASSFEISIPQSHLVARHSLLSSSYTVLPRQEYEVHVVLPSKTYIANRRYKQFKQLHRQLQHISKVQLAEFPKKTVHCLDPEIVAYRTAALESYLRVVAIEAELLPVLLEFLGVSATETPQIVVKADTEGKPERPNEGEMLVLMLESRLVRQQDNKVSALDTFNSRFFRAKRTVRREYVGTIVGKLVELVGDEVCGSLALEIISKAVSASLSRSASEFKSALVHLPVATLSSMHLDQHLLGRFPGDGSQAAFSVLSLLHDHYQAAQPRNWTLVLNGSEEAREAFTNWVQGTMLVRKSVEGDSEGQWVQMESGDGLRVEQRRVGGELEMRVTLSSVKASAQRIVDCVVLPALSKKWNTHFTSIKHLESPSPEERVVEFTVENRGLFTIMTAICVIEAFPNGDKEVTFYETDSSRSRKSPITTYWIEPFLKPAFLPGRAEDSTSSNESPDSPELMRQDSVLSECKVEVLVRLTGELRKKVLEDLAISMDRIIGVWKRLKAFAETEKAERLRLSPEDTPLHVACASKILTPRKVKREG